MSQKRETTIYGPQSLADLPAQRPVPDRPVMLLVGSPDGSWWYRWWDRGHDYVAGEPPTVDKQRPVFEAVLPSMLADWARVHGDLLSHINAP